MTDEEMREKALKLITPFIDDEWHGKGYPVKAELTADGLIPLIREETLKEANVERLKAELDALHRERIGEVWYWQSDGEDHLESLSCPVLINPMELKLLLEQALKTGQKPKEE